MARKYNPEPNKTYATEAHVDKAVEKIFGQNDKLTYVIMRDEKGRFFPLFIGNEAVHFGVHFHFNVASF